MKHSGIAYVKIIREMYQVGDTRKVEWLVEITRDHHRRIYKNVRRYWRLWLEAHTTAIIFTDDRGYPKEAIDNFGIPNPAFTFLRRK
jgi:hypothetical protein